MVSRFRQCVNICDSWRLNVKWCLHKASTDNSFIVINIVTPQMCLDVHECQYYMHVGVRRGAVDSATTLRRRCAAHYIRVLGDRKNV